MSYRGSLPPGQPYGNGQQPIPQPGYQQYGNQQYGSQQYGNQQYGNGNAYGNPQYHGGGQHPPPNPQYPPPNPQAQPMPAYANTMNSAPPQYQSYNGGAYGQNSLPPPTAQYSSQQHQQHHHQHHQQQYQQQITPVVPPAMPPAIIQQQQMPPPRPTHPHPTAQPQTKRPHDGTVNMADIQPQRRASDGPSHQPVAKKARHSMPAHVGSKSPSIPHSPSHHLDTPSLLVCVADDMFQAAQTAVQGVASSLDTDTMGEYYKLIATGLGCLDAALTLNKFPPRVEAKVRLRYATILSEETENLMEAETALTKGIATCEKNRLMDLQYSMQFQLLKVLFRRNRKAALVAVDKQISEAMTFKRVAWWYAFRFLRASFHLQSGNPADVQALENLHSVSQVANHRGDLAIAVLVSLLEGMTHLKAKKDDMITRVQTCIAQASKYQLNESVHIPQIDVLILLLDLECSLQQKTPTIVMQKLRALQARMDAILKSASSWSSDELLLPIKKTSSSNQSISEDTRTILRPGPDEHDFLNLSFATPSQAFIVVYVLSGITILVQPAKVDKALEFWTEALRMLAIANDQLAPSHLSLPMAIEQANWRADISCYLYVLIALIAATRTQWTKMKECMEKIEALDRQPRSGSLDLSVLYMTGVYYQGTGNLDAALEVFEDERFAIGEMGSKSGAAGSNPSSIAILAYFNRLWIMQEPSRRDDEQTAELIEKLRAYCVNHADEEIKTAFSLVQAGIENNPQSSTPLGVVKNHIGSGLNGSKATSNTMLLAIALCLMRNCLFENVVGDQTVKSARAGSAQAKKTGNLLWMSLADGMLAQTCDMQGNVEEAQALREAGTMYANQAFLKPS